MVDKTQICKEIFRWYYQILQWNLMCRIINVDKLKFQHVIMLDMSKYDQTGKVVSRNNKHIFEIP